MMHMQKSMIVIFLIVIVAACSKHAQPVTSGEKAKLNAELIIDSAACSSFKSELTSPAIDDAAIKKIYQDAMKAHCIYKDV
jgi:hypothetical protein